MHCLGDPLIQVDIGGYLFHGLEKQFSIMVVFRVPNFRGRFEALNDVFWGFGAEMTIEGTNLGQ
jgi:hypothetical protein